MDSYLKANIPQPIPSKRLNTLISYPSKVYYLYTLVIAHLSEPLRAIRLGRMEKDKLYWLGNFIYDKTLFYAFCLKLSQTRKYLMSEGEEDDFLKIRFLAELNFKKLVFCKTGFSLIRKKQVSAIQLSANPTLLTVKATLFTVNYFIKQTFPQ